jgi:hypothetical protein
MGFGLFAFLPSGLMVPGECYQHTPIHLLIERYLLFFEHGLTRRIPHIEVALPAQGLSRYYLRR